MYVLLNPLIVVPSLSLFDLLNYELTPLGGSLLVTIAKNTAPYREVRTMNSVRLPLGIGGKLSDLPVICYLYIRFENADISIRAYC